MQDQGKSLWVNYGGVHYLRPHLHLCARKIARTRHADLRFTTFADNSNFPACQALRNWSKQ